MDWRIVREDEATVDQAQPPQLLVKTSDFVADASTLVQPVVSIKASRSNTEECPRVSTLHGSIQTVLIDLQVLFRTRLRCPKDKLEGIGNTSLPGLEVSSDQLSYTSSNIDTCLEDFRAALSILKEGLERVKEEKVDP